MAKKKEVCIENHHFNGIPAAMIGVLFENKSGTYLVKIFSWYALMLMLTGVLLFP